MLKRTKRHAKQNLEHLADVEFSGADAVGVIKEVTQFFSTFCVTVSALRLKTLQTSLDDDAQVKCKMVVSMPHNVDLADFECQFHSLLSTLHLNGAIKQKN